MTPEQAKRLVASMGFIDIIRSVFVEQNDEWIRAARIVIESQAQRIRELEGAAITDAAAERFLDFWFGEGSWDGKDLRDAKRGWEHALRSESHQASAED